MSETVTTKKPTLITLLKKYPKTVLFLAIAVLLANIFYLIVPQLISTGIDSYTQQSVLGGAFYIQFALVAFGMFLFTYVQSVLQTYLAERASYDMRNELASKISNLSYKQIEDQTTSKLLTNFTSDVQAIKDFLSFAVGIIIFCVVVIIGAAGLLLSINWKLAMVVLLIIPFIGVVFGVLFSKLGPLFKKTQEIIDGFNVIIGQSVVGAAIVRVLNLGTAEYRKFREQNDVAKENSLKIIRSFSLMIPFVGLISNLAALIILLLGGKYVIESTMSLGDFTAFNSYVFILIFPIIMLGFVSTNISKAQESYRRIQEVLSLSAEKELGTVVATVSGAITVRGVSLQYGEKNILDNVSFEIKPKTKNAIIGPVAAGKTQLLQVMFGLTQPTSGSVAYDGVPVSEYLLTSLYSQIAFVFQDSVLFNLSIVENIAFNTGVSQEDLQRAIDTAEIDEFIGALPKGMDTVISERGTSLSGGQKQRIMLARALALNPTILFLDDFTARVDAATELSILKNIEKNYPNITLISVTQKIRTAQQYDNIIVLMQGEKIAEGTHDELLCSSTEYAQIVASQKSTQSYE
jgi:ATP-binding cassette subfamily B protein